METADSLESNNKGKMWQLDQRLDEPMDAEAGRLKGVDGRKALPALVIVRLAFQSLGVVYGDLSTSPLYVFNNTFPNGIHAEDDLLGVLSLIIYTLTLIPLIKYTFVVMRANDNGEGGTFALYSLICRHAKINTITNQHPTDKELTTYSQKNPDDKSLARKTKQWLEAKDYRQYFLLLLVLFGTCMVIGDGILTPAISVLSSVGGIRVNDAKIENGYVVAIAIVILIGLFSLQRFGTDKVGWAFAPAVMVWLLSIVCIGIYNIVQHDPKIFRAFSPYYLFHYFINNKKRGWVSLGGVLLSVTGTEALYADIGHFSALAVQLAFTALVFPCLLVAYIGQAAYLTRHPEDVHEAFYKSIPGPVYWPMFVVATIAATIASQATISATFSIIKQAVALGCFPRVKVVHTSKIFPGQIYIPEINWILMILCLAITAGFRKTVQIGNAYGIAVMAVMLVTTILMTLVMLLVWKSNIIIVVLFASIFLFVELIYFSAVLFKVGQGGWAPLVIAFVFLVIMYVWHYGTSKKYEFEMQSKVSLGWILGLGPSLGLVRVPGIGFVYTELAHGVPSIFSHFVTHLPAIHSIVIFVCIKYLPVNTVPQEERFLFRRVGTKEFCLYRCVVRYGYKDLHKRDDLFEENLIEDLAHFIRENVQLEGNSQSDETISLDQLQESLHLHPEADRHLYTDVPDDQIELHSVQGNSDESSASRGPIEVMPPPTRLGIRVRFASPPREPETEYDLELLRRAKEVGVVHILGDVIVRAKRESNLLKKFTINYIYAFLCRFCRENSTFLKIPHESIFNVGQVYYV